MKKQKLDLQFLISSLFFIPSGATGFPGELKKTKKIFWDSRFFKTTTFCGSMKPPQQRTVGIIKIIFEQRSNVRIIICIVSFITDSARI